MGVTGLWQLLESVGRPVRLETLEGKVLAVDVSIWLHQAVKGMRDRDGNPVQNAHLISLFNKVCKLLFYRVKPVFVFDGGVPALKKKTLAGRKERKEQAERESQNAAKKMLTNYLKSYAMQQVMGDSQPGTSNSVSLNLPSTSRAEPDMYELPPMPVKKQDDPSDTDSSEEEFYQSYLQNLNDVDIESADFKNLPYEMQHEILSEMKEARKRNFWATMEDLPEDSSDFSNYQMKKLLKQNNLSARIDDVRKDMNQQQAGEVTGGLADDYYGMGDIESRRVVSDDTSHYVLIKGLAKKKKQRELAMKKEEERLDDLRKYFEDIDNKKEDALPSTSSHITKFPEKKNGQMMNRVLLSASDLQEQKEPSPSTSGLKLKQACLQGDQAVVVVDLDDESDDDMDDKNGETVSKEKVMGWVKATQDHIGGSEGVSMATGTIARSLEDGNGASSTEDSSGEDVKVLDTISSDAESNVKMSAAHSLDKIVDITRGGEIPTDKDKKNLKNLVQKGETINLVDTQSSEEVVSEEKVDTDTSTIERLSRLDQVASEVKPEAGKKPLPDVSEASETVTEERFDPDGQTKELLSTDSTKSQTELSTGETSEQRGIILTDTASPSVVNIASDDEDDDFIEIPEMSADVTFSRSMSQVNEYADEGVPNGGTNEIPDLEKDVEMQEDKSASENFRAQLAEMTATGFEEFQHELQEEAVSLQSQRGKQARLAATIGDQIYTEAQELLTLFGMPYLISPMEAEAQCAHLDLSGQTQGTITDDSDVWLFGGRRVYKNFFNKGKLVEFFKIEDCVSQFGLDRDKLINIALLCGSDYTQGIQGVGPVTAMEIMAEFPGERQNGLKALKKWWRKARKGPVLMSDTKLQTKLRQVSLQGGFPDPTVVEAYLNPEVDQSEEAFSWATPELDSLRDYTREKLGWTQAKTDEILLPVLKQLNKPSTQGRITSFFTPDIHQPVRKPKSKRMKKTIDKIRNPGASGESESPKKTTKRNEPQKAAKPVVKKVLKEVCLSESSSSESSSSGSESEAETMEDETENEALMAAMFDEEFEDEPQQQQQQQQKHAQKPKVKVNTKGQSKAKGNTKKKDTLCSDVKQKATSSRGKSKTSPKPTAGKANPKPGRPVLSTRARSSHMPL